MDHLYSRSWRRMGELDGMTRRADYQCQSCQHRWSEQIPMIQTRQPYKTGAEPCPRCGHLYCAWLNYEKDFAK